MSNITEENHKMIYTTDDVDLDGKTIPPLQRSHLLAIAATSITSETKP